MSENDLLMLKTFVLAHGLVEVICGLSAVCSEMSLELAQTNAHEANTMMHASVALDHLAAETDLSDYVSLEPTG